MIKYRLRCHRGHEFESWFESSAAFDKLAKRRSLSCAECGSTRVEKAIMAPRLAKVVDAEAPVRGRRGAAVATGRDGDQDAALRLAIRAFREAVLANTEDVGDRFVEEARRMHEDRQHDEDAPVRGIHGEASLEDAQSQIEDGIMVLPVPRAPDELN